MADGRPHFNLHELGAALMSRLEALAEALLGPPNKSVSNRRQWRWGRKGSLALDISGPRRGLWINREDGRGGRPLRLIQHARKCSFDDAVAWAASFVGVADPGSPGRVQDRRTDAQRAEKEKRAAAEAADRRQRIKRAQRLHRRSTRIEGTIAERYLNATRGIPTPAGGWPAVLRFLAESSVRLPGGQVRETAGALLAAATLPDGTIQAVQLVHLDAAGENLRRDDEKRTKIKLTYGVLDGAAVRLPGPADGPLIVAEGPETGLSVWAATGHETHVALGTLTKLRPPVGRRLVIARDDDHLQSPADKALTRAITEWRGAGVDGVIATPWPLRRADGSDFNDVLRARGAEAVRARIALALDPSQGAPLPRREPVAVARVILAGAIEQFLTAAAAYNANLQAAEAEALVAAHLHNEQILPAEILAEKHAKTEARRATQAAAEPRNRTRTASCGLAEAALRKAAQQADQAARMARACVAEASAAAEPFRHEANRIERTSDKAAAAAARARVGPPPVQAVRAEVGLGKSSVTRQGVARLLRRMRAEGDPRTVAYAVPTHKLGAEQAAAFQALPDARASGLQAAIWRGRKQPDPTTPGHKMCRDLDAVADAQAALMDPQTSVCRRIRDGNELKCPFFDTCGYQRQRRSRADVWFVPHELLFSKKPSALGDLALVVVDEAAWQDGLVGQSGPHIQLSLDDLAQDVTIPSDPIGTQQLNFLRLLLHETLQHLSDGPVPRKPILAAGFTVESGTDGHKLEWSRKADAEIYPGMPAGERKAAARAAQANRLIRRCAMLWQAIEALARDDGPTASGWAELGRAHGKDGRFRVVHLKGRRKVGADWQVPTLLLDAIFELELARPHWPDVTMIADVRVAAPHQRIRQVMDRCYSKRHLSDPGNARTVHAIIGREARRYSPGRVLVVVQKDAEEALPDIGPLPVNVELAHHNAVAGRDEWGPGRDRAGVAALILVGRAAAPPAAVKRQAEALTGVAVDHLPGWYDKVQGAREMADGTVRPAEADQHPHPVAEAIRKQITEGELLQIIGRARGVNRTEADPVEVLVMTDAALPLPIAEVISATDLSPSPLDLMLAAGGIAFANPNDAAMAYPDLWPNRGAAKTAFRRGGWVHSLISTYHSEIVPNLSKLEQCEYQRAGSGCSPALAWYDSELVRSISDELHAKLGPLAWISSDIAIKPLPAEEVANPCQLRQAHRGIIP